jgi:hypothetical protein
MATRAVEAFFAVMLPIVQLINGHRVVEVPVHELLASTTGDASRVIGPRR